MSTAYDLLTYQDAVDHLIDVFNLDGSTRDERLCRRSIAEALSDLTGARNWLRYQRSFRVTTSANQSDGTVTYVSSTRLLTLSGATWPADAILGEVEIDGVIYKPETRQSSTVLLLRAEQCPSSDIASASEYVWQRDRYALADDFGSMGQIVCLQTKRPLDRCTIDQLLTHKRQTLHRGDPVAYCVTGLPEYGGGMGIQFSPVPTAARNFDAAYIAYPRTPRTKLENTGTVLCTADSTTVTGSGTAFASLHVGSVLRIASTADDPTNFSGYSDGTSNPWVEQLVIKSVTSATVLVTEQPATQTLAAGRGYTISDLIDMDTGAMMTAFLRLTEARYCRMTARPDRGEREGAADRAFVEACMADRRNWNTDSNSRPAAGLLRDLATGYDFGM